MRLVTFATDGEPRLGALHQGYVVDLPAAHAAMRRTRGQGVLSAPFPATLMDLLNGGSAARQMAAEALAFAAKAEHLSALALLGYALSPAEITYLPPVPRPGKIFCLGHNYKHHVLEMGGQLPDFPVLFAKFSNTLIGHGAPIVLPAVSEMVDYEAEMAIIVGRRGRDIPMESALDYIAGFAIFNDVSVRDWQKRTVQWLQGKTFDGTGPIGPALVTLDELKDPLALAVELRLNGSVMQSSNTSDFIFSVPKIMNYISQIATLEPGDVIATGTPSGVGFARKPPVFLKPGDVVEVEIGGLGVLKNPVVAGHKV